MFAQHLRVLTIDTSDITDNWFCSVVHNCPLLEVVELSDCNLLTDMSVIELVQHAEHLTALAITRHDHFTDAALDAIAEHSGERLRHLCLHQCESITDAGLHHISEACYQLEGLDFGSWDMEHITIPAIKALLQNNPLLQEVRLSWHEAADTLLETLAESCPQLRYLDIMYLDGLYSEVGVVALITSCTHLCTVVIHADCAVISEATDSIWQQRYCPELEFLYETNNLPFWIQYRYSAPF